MNSKLQKIENMERELAALKAEAVYVVVRR